MWHCNRLRDSSRDGEVIDGGWVDSCGGIAAVIERLIGEPTSGKSSLDFMRLWTTEALP